MPSKTKKTPEFNELPVLPVRDTVLFPNAILPLTVGRESSLKLISDLKEEERFIAVVAQRDPRVDNPQPVELYQIGTAAFIHKIIKLPSQSLFIFVEGLQRIALQEMISTEPYLRARVLFVILATIIVLENLGIHLTAVWTTLGVGSVAIALALQETLSNLFAGLYIMADRPINAGDYVKLDSGHEGTVVQIGWRATSIRSLANNVVFVPNSSLAKATITNYSLPEERMVLSIPVSVSYSTDPKHLESVLLEAVEEAGRDGVPGLLLQPAPSVRFIPGFGASSLDFSLNVQIRRYADQYAVQSELRSRILDHCNRAGIEMPFPTRTLVLDKSVLDLLSNKPKEAASPQNVAPEMKGALRGAPPHKAP